jgi:hypothetical protein
VVTRGRTVIVVEVVRLATDEPRELLDVDALRFFRVEPQRQPLHVRLRQLHVALRHGLGELLRRDQARGVAVLVLQRRDDIPLVRLRLREAPRSSNKKRQ